MSNALRRGGIVVIAVASMFLLWSAVQSAGVYRQRVEQVNLRAVCRCLSDIDDTLYSMEHRGEFNVRDIRHLRDHVKDLEKTIRRGWRIKPE